MQIANLGLDNFLWRLGVARIYEWVLKSWQEVFITGNNLDKRKAKVSEILTNKWLEKIKVAEAQAWDIVQIAWIPDIFVWETVWWNEDVEAMPSIIIDEPTLKMEFLVNDSPFAWKEGKFVTGRQLRERLEKELEINVWLKIDFDSTKNYIVSGRGELHLSVFIETMRREWFELQVWAPVVIMCEKDGKKMEPIERVSISLPSEFSGTIIWELGKRKWEIINMSDENSVSYLEFLVPTRWLLWFKSEFTTLTKGQGLISSAFEKFAVHKWNIEKRARGSMISMENWKTMAYSLFNLQERWTIFIHPATDIYEGMIIWESSKDQDLTVNATKNKKLTNVRASWSDEAIKLTPPKIMSLEESIDYISEDEYVEITPESIRLRKKYLSENDRKRNKKN